jgi:excisionase family DNA binding protein
VTEKENTNTNYMSSNMQLEFVCEYCKKEFTAKKTTTRFCSHNCARQSHKERTRNAKITNALARRSEIKPIQPKSAPEYSIIKDKELLTINEASQLLNITPVTFRRWLKAKKVISSRIGKKHMIQRTYLDKLISRIE